MALWDHHYSSILVILPTAKPPNLVLWSSWEILQTIESFNTFFFLLKLINIWFRCLQPGSLILLVLCHSLGTLALGPDLRGGSLDLLALDYMGSCKHVHGTICPTNPVTFCYLPAMLA